MAEEKKLDEIEACKCSPWTRGECDLGTKCCYVHRKSWQDTGEPAEEKNKRLAQTKLPDGTTIEREWTPHERYMLFAKGFRDGASRKAIDKEREGLGAYDRGYDEGIQASRQAVSAYAKEIGYEPTILRTAENPPRCSLCGSTRIVKNGRAGACSLVPGRDGKGGCPDPLHDVRQEDFK